MEVPRLRVELELQLLAYTTATATGDPSHNCHLHHSSRQCWVLNHRGRPGIETVSSWILVRFVNCWAMKGTPSIFSFSACIYTGISYLPWTMFIILLAPLLVNEISWNMPNIYLGMSHDFNFWKLWSNKPSHPLFLRVETEARARTRERQCGQEDPKGFHDFTQKKLD